MIGFNGQYLSAAAIGDMRITAMGQGAYDLLGTFSWLVAATKAAILSAFGAEGAGVIQATNAYLNAIAATDREKAQALAGFINEDPMLVCSIVETSKTRYASGGVSTQLSTGIVPTLTMQINAKFRISQASQYHPIFQQGYISEDAQTTRCICNDGSTEKLYIGFCRKTAGGSAVYTDTSGIVNKWIEIENLNDTGCTVDGTDITFTSTDRGTTNNNPIWLFGRGDTYGMENIDIAFFETIDGEQRHNLVPFVREGANYWLDIETLQLTEGAFTIAITDKAPSPSNSPTRHKNASVADRTIQLTDKP